MSSTMIRVKIDRARAEDLHEQVAAELRRAIAEGEARPGERLPPALLGLRQLPGLQQAKASLEIGLRRIPVRRSGACGRLFGRSCARLTVHRNVFQRACRQQ